VRKLFLIVAVLIVPSAFADNFGMRDVEPATPRPVQVAHEEIVELQCGAFRSTVVVISSGEKISRSITPSLCADLSKKYAEFLKCTTIEADLSLQAASDLREFLGWPTIIRADNLHPIKRACL
jgi:hypothetical protein